MCDFNQEISGKNASTEILAVEFAWKGVLKTIRAPIAE